MSERPRKKASLRQRIRATARGAAIGLGAGTGVAYLAYRNRIRRLEDPDWTPEASTNFIIHVLENAMARIGRPGHWVPCTHEDPEVRVHDSHWDNPHETDPKLH